MSDAPIETTPVRIDLDGEQVDGLFRRPPEPRALLVFAHGAGSDMRHAFMEAMSEALAGVGFATLRYQFPFAQRGSRRPDPRPVLLETVRAAVLHARRLAPDLPRLAGGKSMGGRMTSLAEAEEQTSRVRGIVFFGFPLHPAGRPGIARAEHLLLIDPPMLFLQGGRDRLAESPLVDEVMAGLGRGATLHRVPAADHGFHVPKSSGRTDQDVIEELARTVATWAAPLL